MEPSAPSAVVPYCLTCKEEGARKRKVAPKTRACEGRRKLIELIGTKFAEEESCRLGLKTFEYAGVSQAKSGGVWLVPRISACCHDALLQT